MLLLAKDGIYLPIAPRAVVQGLLASGNRADLLINCPEGDFNFTSTKVNDEPGSGSGESGSGSGSGESGSGSGSGESGSGSGSGEPSSGEPEEPNLAAKVIEKTLLFIRANKSPGDSQTCDLPVFEVNRPCYLVDLRKQEVAKSLTFVQAGNYKSFYNGTDSTRYSVPPSPKDPVLTQKSEWELQFEAGHVQYTAPVGEVIGLDLYSVDVHPFHIHVNPFQLSTIDTGGANEWLSEWFKNGDWHDTLFIPDKADSTQRVLMQTDYFTGPSVVHCHRMMHEDQGMMVT
eukprot:scaffold1906_cov59-Phaeocystis_antarctica.AAC.1